jgi:methyltransferase-like protein
MYAMKLSVHFEERFEHFVFDMLTTDNSTKIKTISTQVFGEFTTHNLSGFARKSTVKKYLAQDSPSIRRQIREAAGSVLTMPGWFCVLIG